MKAAIIHDWLTGMRGGEKVLEEICILFPDADLYTLIHIKGSVSTKIEGMNIKTSFLQYFPNVGRYYRYLLPLMPKAIESFNLTSYDLVISSSHCVAKGIKADNKTCHICYCHTPVRYAWDKYEDYFGEARGLKKILVKRVLNYIRHWDMESSGRVDYFIANSKNIASKIKRYYGADSEVIYPPVDTDFFRPSCGRGDYFLIVSAFALYKRLDIAIEAFNILGYSLKIVGFGQDDKKIRSIALGSNIDFLGSVDADKLRDLYAGCQALIFPGEEDFGIVPVEAQACGTPVIAYGKGGVIESVVPIGDKSERRASGIFFNELKRESLVEAVQLFERAECRFNSADIRNNALHFTKNIFREKMSKLVNTKYIEYRNGKNIC